MDPIQFLARMRRFAHPSEVTEPVELLRAGVLFHARGLINTKAIQHNLDWVWPYWVERQFNPADLSFIPRAFSFSHINLTHRNWTAVGLPDLDAYPIVDPRGLVTPLFDGWSLDFWLIADKDHRLFPSKLEHAEQRLHVGDNLRVISRFKQDDWQLESSVSVEWLSDGPGCVIKVRAAAAPDVRLAVAVRPYNPEGISFIDSIQVEEGGLSWSINGKDRIHFSVPPEKRLFSNYREGDVAQAIDHAEKSDGIKCDASMASGVALFPASQFSLQAEQQSEIADGALQIRIPLSKANSTLPQPPSKWQNELRQCSQLQIPDARLKELYDIAVASLILHTPGEVYPGPYTYKRFWYRDAAFILHALLTLGASERTRRALDLFPRGQTLAGYFRSQEGEWDSNGEVLWILHRYAALTGEAVPENWLAPIERGAHWILSKRVSKDSPVPHAGLLPAGFSAEHLGPNDFYYWDDFWGVAGLRAASSLLEKQNPRVAQSFAAGAEEFLETIVTSFRHLPMRRFKGAISASPYRRMDAGAVGSIVADYPLQLFPPGDERILRTVEYLLGHSSFKGGFFQNMIHSGINAYLTLHLAQVLLRAGDLRALDLVDTVAGLATQTGQWPEAIHPHTGGGCMGDGQHIWAAAEWALILRSLFVREEADRLVLGGGLFPRWLEKREPLSFGPTLTQFGQVAVRIEPGSSDGLEATLSANWRGQPPKIIWRVPGFAPVETNGQDGKYILRKHQ